MERNMYVASKQFMSPLIIKYGKKHHISTDGDRT